jgi:energy-converting hydrogenase Eha subunit C
MKNKNFQIFRTREEVASIYLETASSLVFVEKIQTLLMFFIYVSRIIEIRAKNIHNFLPNWLA